MINKKGFTLIEAVAYTAVVSLLLLGISSFLLVVLKTRAQTSGINEVEGQGVQAMQQITQTIRNSSAITTPTQGNSGDTLTVDGNTFSLNGTILEMDSVGLTSSEVVISGLDFKNLSFIDTPGIVKIEFTVTKDNYSKTFYDTASLRQ